MAGDFVPLSTVHPVSRTASASSSSASSSSRSSSTLFHACLTVVFAGLQFAWAVEFAFGSPYLLALGLPPSLVSLVWLAGPLSGLIMQPVIGALSDSCTLRLGRRRPFIIGAALCICLSLWVVAWSVEIADVVFKPAPALPPAVPPPPHQPPVPTSTASSTAHLLPTPTATSPISSHFATTSHSDAVVVDQSIKSIAAAIVAIIGFYALDFSINAVQATARALVVDILPPDQQEAGTACASRMINIGNVAGYFVGQADLQAHFGWIAGSHVKILCVFAILAMLSTTAITCVCVKEAPLSSSAAAQRSGEDDGSIENGETENNSGQKLSNTLYARTVGMVVGLWHSARALPSPIQQIFNVQFFAWIGWFPFLFYNTSYVAGLYLTQSKATGASTHVKRSSGGGDGGEYPEEATRAGSFAMLVYAIVSLVLSWFLPLAVAKHRQRRRAASVVSTPSSGSYLRLNDTFDDTEITHSHTRQQPSNGFVRGMRRIRQHLTLRRLWTASHVVFAVLMFSTFFISTVRGATFMIATCGFCWAVTAWVPFSLIGEMVSSHGNNSRTSRSIAAGNVDDDGEYDDNDVCDDDDEGNNVNRDIDLATTITTTTTTAADSQPTLRVNVRSDDSRSSSRNSNSSDEELTAGVVLGIHNVYVVCPQFITAFMSSLIFAMAQSSAFVGNHHNGGEEDGGGDVASPIGGIVWVFRIGGVSALIAAYLSAKLSTSYR